MEFILELLCLSSIYFLSVRLSDLPLRSGRVVVESERFICVFMLVQVDFLLGTNESVPI